MEEYRFSRRLFSDVPVERFWVLWWDIADRILPPLLPEEACRETHQFDIATGLMDKYETMQAAVRIVQHRADRWMGILATAGYSGWDFYEVIKHHFVQLRRLAVNHDQRKLAWKRHRLMAKPRFIIPRQRLACHWSSSESEED